MVARRLRGMGFALWVVATAAGAAPCAGFADVEDTDAFCPNVQWLRNRAITAGCDAVNYCPGNAVTRLQMAAFMNRLGTVLTPRAFSSSGWSSGTFDLDTEIITCSTAIGFVPDYPRRAYVDASVSTSASVEVTFGLEIVYAINGVGPWLPLTTQPVRATVGAGQWAGASQPAQLDVSANQAVYFAVRLGRGGVAGNGNLSDIICDLRALVHSRDGSTPPL